MRVSVAVCACAAAFTTGCLSSRAGKGDVAPVEAADSTPSARIGSSRQIDSWPFAPASIRIHPISQAHSDAKGPRIVCHVECRDPLGETTKAVGSLRIEVLEPTRTVEPGMEQIAAAWVTDLSDLDNNSKLYDPSTRTYRLSLRQLPGFMVESLSDANKRGGRTAVVRATLEPAMLPGQKHAQPMSDEFRLSW
jgi:hypothetical protein